jgi:predicted small metal-binding protein
MTLVVHCRDIGFDCDGVIKAEDEKELMKQVAAHAGEVHDIKEVTPELVEKVRSVVSKE